MVKIKKRIRYLQHYFQILIKSGIKSANKYKEDFKYLNNSDKEKIKAAHVLSDYEIKQQSQYTFSKNPKISILTPLFNTPENFLVELIESVQKQTYSNWELCFCDASDIEHKYVMDIVDKYQKEDSRILYKKLTENKGISGNTNECLKIASGQFISLLDHDDVLHPSALYETVRCIENGADFIYTDEAKFSDSIEDILDRSHFNFKGGFGFEELESHNYICHFTTYSKDLLNCLEQPYYRSEFDGSQDHDMVLRLTEKANHIEHISKVLYYWRFHDQSVSMNLSSKSYAVDAGIHAIQSHLNRLHISGVVSSNLPYLTIYKSNLEIQNPLISIVFYGKGHSINDILNKTSYKNIEIKDVVNINETVNECKGEYIILYNLSLIPQNMNWIEELLMQCQKDKVGVVGPKILNNDESIYSGGYVLTNDREHGLLMLGEHNWNFEEGYEAFLKCTRNVSSLDLSCMMFKKSSWKLVNGFNESMKSYMDISFCTDLLEIGYRNIWCSQSCLKMMNSIENSHKKDSYASIFKKQYKNLIDRDPYYNENWIKLNLI